MATKKPDEGLVRAGWISFMDKFDQFIYGVTGISFLLIGAGTFVYAWINFGNQISISPLHAILNLINDLMLVLIILEILRTIINYLKSQDILLEPFLYIGIIAATRKMLTAGAEISIMELTDEKIFNRYLTDVGVNALVVVALAVGLFLIRRRGKEVPG